MNAVGILGLGLMGAAIARRMLEQGIAVRVWNRSHTAALDDLIAAGAEPAESAADALSAPVSFSVLADDAAAEAVLSTASEIAHHNTDGHSRIHVNMSTLSVDAADRITQRLSELGISYVAAPLLGRPEAALAGNINMLLAGDAAVLDKIDPLLASFTAKRWRFGDRPRTANAVKIAMNFMLMQALESIGEGIALIETEGVPASDFVELFTSTTLGGSIHRTYGKIIAERRYSPVGASLEIGLKDLGLAEQLAAEAGLDLAAAPVMRDRFETALADPELAGLDWAVIAELSRGQIER